MSRIRLLVGLFVAVSADVGSGILAVHLLGKVFGQPIALWMYGVSIFVALLPDIDVIFQKIGGENIDSRHRQMTHYPVAITLIFANIVVFSWFWATLTALCLLAHFVHDSWGEANRWGVKWLAPFSDKSYQLFMRKRFGERRQIICVWTPEELANTAPLPLEEWLTDYYLRLTGESVGGLLWLVGSIIISLLW